MGNSPSEPKASFNSYIPGDNALKEDQGEGNLLANVETELEQINSTLNQLKAKSPDEIEKELHTLLIDTEKKLRHVTSNKKEMDASGNDSQLMPEIEKLRQEKEDLKKKYTAEIEESKRKLADELENEKLKNKQLLLRLSKVAEEQLTKDNPAITILSDTNRPNKLGEIYSELYDNEWTDALDGLTAAGYNDVEAIATLYLTLLNIYNFCKMKAETMLTKTDDAVNYLFEEYKLLYEKNEAHVTRMPRERVSVVIKTASEDHFSEVVELRRRWEYKTGHPSGKENNRESVTIQRSDKITDKLKVFQKEVAEIMVPVVQKAYLKASWMDDECVSELKPFIRKCIFVCWMMVVQSPPMCIHIFDLKEQGKFDKNLYKEYTSSGPFVQYIVWPAMLLHENGSVECKGIAQGCDTVTNPNNNENASAC